MPELRYSNIAEDIINVSSTEEDLLYPGIVIIGTSSLGPMWTPMRIFTVPEAISAYGDGELLYACQEALDTNIRLYLMRIGSPNLNSQDRYTALSSAYDILEGALGLNVIVPLQAYFDSDLPFTKQLADFCSAMTRHGKGILGIVGVSELNYNKLSQLSPIPNGEHIVVFAGRPTFHIDNLASISSLERYVSTGEAAYAKLLVNLPLKENTTNKRFNTSIIFENFLETEYKTLSKVGITTLRESINRGYVIHEGVTLSPTSTYRHLGNMRVVLAIKNFIGHVLDDYIGNPVFQHIRADKQISEYMDTLKNTETIRNYELSIQIVENEIVIDIKIVPIYSLLTIEANVRGIVRR